jgi:hypothetical protein
MRSDLAHAALANDLFVQASSSQTELSNRYQVDMSINAPSCPPTPTNCPPCGGGSSGGPIGSSGGGGLPIFGGSSGGSNANTGSASGCAAAPEHGGNGGAGIELVLAGLVATSILVKRGRRRS